MVQGRTRRPPANTSRRTRQRDGTRSPALNIRIDFDQAFALGPGKIRLMELIAEHGSISAAGRAMGMSYRRAWLLVDNLNRAFKEPLVLRQTGGSNGGGADLTKLGRSVVARYRAIEAAATTQAGADLRALAGALQSSRR